MTDTPAPQTRSYTKDPLVHFLIAGSILFILLSWIAPEDETQHDIVVDHDALLTFIQYRTKIFQPELAEKRLIGLSEQERRNLIDDYIEEEAMYREAISMGLEGDDYVIRRRMVQKLEFITQGFVEQELELSDAELQDYFNENRQDYFVDPSISFTHVFLSSEKKRQLNTESSDLAQQAQELLKELHDDQVSFSQAIGYGDRFPFHVNYVERTPEFVASHFGQSFSDEVFSLDAKGDSPWYGPFQSQYGLHLVKVSERLEGRLPELDEVKGIVAQDLRQATIREHQKVAIKEIVAQYNIIER
ncbi:MAG: peptidyl-prolyl cis-trans isomerase [Cellvibrionaceae bacterium]